MNPADHFDKQPMSQFTVIGGVLLHLDTGRYDFWYGFGEVIKRLDTKE